MKVTCNECGCTTDIADTEYWEETSGFTIVTVFWRCPVCDTINDIDMSDIQWEELTGGWGDE